MDHTAVHARHAQEEAAHWAVLWRARGKALLVHSLALRSCVPCRSKGRMPSKSFPSVQSWGIAALRLAGLAGADRVALARPCPSLRLPILSSGGPRAARAPVGEALQQLQLQQQLPWLLFELPKLLLQLHPLRRIALRGLDSCSIHPCVLPCLGCAPVSPATGRRRHNFVSRWHGRP